MQKSRVGELDYFRGLAIVAIVMQHLIGYINHPQATQGDVVILSIFWHLINFGIPAFVLISGTALFFNYGDIEKLEYGKFITKRVSQILLPYLLWTMIYIFNNGLGSNSVLLIPEILYYFITGRANYHLWFIVMIFQFYLLLPVFRRLFIIIQTRVKKRLHFSLLGVIFCAQLAINWVYHYVLPHISLNEEVSRVCHLIYSYTYLAFILWAFYFVLGGIAGLKYEKSKDWVSRVAPYNILLWFSLFIYLLYQYTNVISLRSAGINAETLTLYHPYVALFNISTIITACQICIWLNANHKNVIARVLRSIGQYSLGIYFAHPLIIDLLNKELYSVPDYSPSVKFLLTSALTIIIIIPGSMITQGVLSLIKHSVNAFHAAKNTEVSK